MKIYRQGDVLLIEVKVIPKDAFEQPIVGHELVLAYGEATGHRHRVEFLDKSDGVKLYHASGGERYLHVAGVTLDLLHEEHETVKVPPGKYLIPSRFEYTPAELRRVAD